jgi:predicted 3-demethylubiquinone-9 3-methyltransferase (glyoxalase superfamily)
MQKITPFLWFDNEAEEAANFYVSLFKDSKIVDISRYSEAGPLPAGTVMVIQFVVAGQPITALNGGPVYKLNEAFSLSVSCEDQAEVDELWERLTAGGGEPGQCGWLKDRWGLSWQIVPKALPELLGDPNPERAQRAAQAMFKMQKIDIQAMRDAADGK